MSATALASIPVGVVVERRKAASPWIDFVWSPAAVLPGAPEMAPWTVLSEEEGTTSFFGGNAVIELHRTETGNYRDNLATGAPRVWVALRETGADQPYTVAAVTVDPAEGEAFTEAGTDIVDAVPMPDVLRDLVAAFVAEHHVEQTFFKRKRNRADPEALARRAIVKDDER